MLEKLPVLLSYALVGVGLALWPTIALKWPPDAAIFRWRRPPMPWLPYAALVIAGVLIAKTSGLRYLAAAAIIAGGMFVMERKSDDRIERVAGCAVALIVVALLPWWRRAKPFHFQLSWGEAAAFCVLALLALATLQRRSDRAATLSRTELLAAISVFCLVSFYLAFSTGIYGNTDVLLTAWHHWGAYIGPAESLWSGARIFYDVTAQYGLGPTVAIAGSCSLNCWAGMYALSGLFTMAFCLLIATLVYNLASDAGFTRPAYLLALVLTIICCFFWTSYPPAASSPTVTPSTSGLRFLPVLLLAAFLIWRYGRDPRPRGIAGHTAWALASLWSPESSFYATLVWWPSYLWMRCAASAPGNFWKLVFNVACEFVVALAALVFALDAVYWLVFRVHPSFYAYWAYILNPPGPMPINPLGTIWYFGAALVAGVVSLVLIFQSEGDGPAFRRLFILLLTAYGAFSYFLGRSHDNNVLNLMPFIMLILLAVMAAPRMPFWVSLATTLYAALLGWICLFGWTAWEEAARAERLFEFSPQKAIATFSYRDPQTLQRIVDRYQKYDVKAGNLEDAVRGMIAIEAATGEPITLLDSTMDLIATPRPKVWSAIQDPADYYFLPPEKRRLFLQNALQTIGRTGWVLIDRSFPADAWLADYDSAYVRIETRDFGSYYAIRYRPRSQATAATK